MSTGIAPTFQDCSEQVEQLLDQFRREIGKWPEAISDFQERRVSPRRKFSCWQLIAEYDGWSFPTQQDFRLYQCYDISATGISFLAEEKLRNDQLIVALGPIPFLFFHLRVVRSTRLKEVEGNPFRIGCRFIKRLVSGNE